MAALPPGSTIGILGGGQLGRMLATAAAQLGYRCHIYAPPGDNVAFDVAAAHTVAEYDDLAALKAFADACDVVTFEFENVPVTPLQSITGLVPVYPPLKALEVAQDRAAEKQFVRALGGKTAEFATAQDESAVPAAIAAVGIPCILKTIRMGYDGKGQSRIMADGDIMGAWERTGGQPLIAEAMVSFDVEFSVILTRGQDGEIRFWDSSQNLHIGGILAKSTLPGHWSKASNKRPVIWHRRSHRRWIMSASLPPNFLPVRRVPCSTKSRPACTIADIGPSKARPLASLRTIFGPFAGSRLEPPKRLLRAWKWKI